MCLLGGQPGAGQAHRPFRVCGLDLIACRNVGQAGLWIDVQRNQSQHLRAVRRLASRCGNPYDNAKAESFMKALKVETVYLVPYGTL
jgi:hypothetical protein